jgi:hypothetical protein
MRGGGRSKHKGSPGAESVHRLLPNYPNTIRNTLEKMTPIERHADYIATFRIPPMDERRLENLKIYRDIYREEYPDEFAKAEKAAQIEAKAAQREAATRLVAEVLASEALTSDYPVKEEFGRSVLGLLQHGLKGEEEEEEEGEGVGGKTRRNRRRRHRNRRSLKRKHSRRR